jgi:hypothetical protein
MESVCNRERHYRQNSFIYPTACCTSKNAAGFDTKPAAFAFYTKSPDKRSKLERYCETHLLPADTGFTAFRDTRELVVFFVL